MTQYKPFVLINLFLYNLAYSIFINVYRMNIKVLLCLTCVNCVFHLVEQCKLNVSFLNGVIFWSVFKLSTRCQCNTGVVVYRAAYKRLASFYQYAKHTQNIEISKNNGENNSYINFIINLYYIIKKNRYSKSRLHFQNIPKDFKFLKLWCSAFWTFSEMWLTSAQNTILLGL